MEDITNRLPLLASYPTVVSWLQFNAKMELAQNTLLRYARDVADYLQFCHAQPVDHLNATPEHIARYHRSLRERIWQRGSVTHVGLSDATIRLRLVVLKLYYTYLKEEGDLKTIPFRSTTYYYHHAAGLLPMALPSDDDTFWLPTALEWQAIVAKMAESKRNLIMLMLAYEGALRREELCRLQFRDLNQASRQLTVRRETTKNRRQRVVPYSLETQQLYAQYLADRRRPLAPDEPVFLSESSRNAGHPITVWSWSKIVRLVGLRVGLPGLRTHTMRHLRITHWAEAGVDVPTIARLVGHKYPQTTMRYIHPRPEHLAEKVAAAMEVISSMLPPTTLALAQ